MPDLETPASQEEPAEAEPRPEDRSRRRAARWAGVLAWFWLAFAVLSAGSLVLFLVAAAFAALHCVAWTCLEDKRLTKLRLSAARFIGVAVPMSIFFLMMGLLLGPGYLPVFAIGLTPFLVIEILMSLAIGRIPDIADSPMEKESSQ